ncbi:MAG: hypothetical protein Greene041619_1030 [Candidatus Peregrinibacteria bacterium Greene0416_19]|nr:MAG: hypothetical protein Greene041619_1030 [Candidatus Peregrinibacteria bacterium Greene0416_19]
MAQNPEVPKGPPDKPPAIVRSLEQMDKVAGPRVVLPKGPLSEAKLEQYMRELENDGALRTYGEVMQWNMLRLARERVRQNVTGAPNEPRVETRVRMAGTEKFPTILQQELSLMRQILALRDRHGINRNAELDRQEACAAAYLQGFAEVLRKRVAVGNAGFLVLRTEEQTKRLGQPDESTAVAQQGAFQDLRNIGFLQAMAPQDPRDPVPQMVNLSLARNRARDLTLQDASKLLNRDVSWFTAYAEGVPGVDEAGVSPVRKFFLLTLSHALEHNRREGLSIRTEDTAKKNENVLKRREIVDALWGYLKDVGDQDLASMQRDLYKYGFDLEAVGAARGKPEPIPPAHLKEYMQGEVTNRIAGFRSHFHQMEEKVLKVTWKDWGEKQWNEKGRFGALAVVEAITALHSLPRRMAATLPVVPDDLGEKYQKEVMGPVRAAMGLPDDFQIFDINAWKSMDDVQWQRVRKKMESTASLITKHQDEIRQRIALMNESLNVINALRQIRDPDDLIGVQPSAVPSGMRVTVADVEKAKGNDALLAALYMHVFEQAQGDWNEYAGTMRTFLGGLEEVLGTHLDLKREFEAAGEKNNWELLKILAALGGGLFAAWVLWKNKGRLARLAFRGTVGGVKAGLNAGRAGVDLTGRTVKKVETLMHGSPKGVAPGAATEGASRLARAGRAGAHLLFVAAEGLDLYLIQDQIRRNMRVKHLEGEELSDAALAFWKQKRIPALNAMLTDGDKEDQWKEEIDVLERRKAVVAMGGILRAQTLPADGDLPQMTPGKSDSLDGERTHLLMRLKELRDRKDVLQTRIGEEFNWIKAELPIDLHRVFVKDPKMEGYGVNVSGLVPGTKLAGGPLEDAREAGARNRYIYGEVMSAIGKKQKNRGVAYLQDLRFGANEAQKTVDDLERRLPIKELERTFLTFQKDAAEILRAIDAWEAAQGR